MSPDEIKDIHQSAWSFHLGRKTDVEEEEGEELRVIKGQQL